MKPSLPLLLAALLAVPRLAAGGDPGDTIDRFADLHPGATVRRVSGLDLDGEGFRLHLASGRARGLLRADGRVGGFVFEGRGRLRFQPEARDADRVIRHNVGALLGQHHYRDGEIELTFDRLLVLGRGDLPSAMTGLPVDPDAPPGALRRRIVERLGVYRHLERPPVEHVLAQAEINGSPGEVFHLLLRSDHGECLFVHDAVRERQETLYRLGRNGSVRTATRIAIRRLGRAPREPVRPPYVVTGSDLVVEDRGLPRLAIEGSLDLVPAQPGRRALRFLLRNQQAGRGVPWNRGGHRIRVVSLHDDRGRPLPFSHRHHELLVALPEPAPAGRPLRIEFRLDADIAVRPNGDRYFLLRTLAWHPRSPYDAEAYGMRWEARTAAPYVPLLSGDTVATGTREGRSFRATTAALPVRFGAIVAGKFHCDEFSATPRIRVCTYPGPRPRVASDLAAYFAALAGRLGEVLVPYPFANLTVVELPLLDLAQATPGLILLSREIVLPNLDPVSRLLGADASKRMAHEMAHTWWGQIVKYGDPADIWLSESFAEYFGGVALAALTGDEVMERLRQVWRNAAVRGNDAATIRTAYLLAGPDAFARWFDLLYGKGPLVVDAIRRQLGDQAFFASVRRLLTQTAGGFATTDDLVRVIREETGQDITTLLERCYYGGEMP